MTNVLIVDDERIVQELFTYYIEKTDGKYTLAGAIKDAANAEIYCASGKVDLIIMDVCTVNEHSGIAAAKEIKSKYPDIKIIIVTSALITVLSKRQGKPGQTVSGIRNSAMKSLLMLWIRQ